MIQFLAGAALVAIIWGSTYLIQSQKNTNNVNIITENNEKRRYSSKK